jgi:hypothetical protein
LPKPATLARELAYEADTWLLRVGEVDNEPSIIMLNCAMGSWHNGEQLRTACSRTLYDCGAWIANCRTSIGMLVGTPPGPGAAEMRPATSQARSGVTTSTIQ